MKLTHIDEPELEFGTGKHIDIRFGLRITVAGLQRVPLLRRQINVGSLGLGNNRRRAGWVDKCRQGIAAKASRQPHLFSNFPAFATEAICNRQSILQPLSRVDFQQRFSAS